MKAEGFTVPFFKGETERGLPPVPRHRPCLELGYWDLVIVCTLYLGTWHFGPPKGYIPATRDGSMTAHPTSPRAHPAPPFPKGELKGDFCARHPSLALSKSKTAQVSQPGNTTFYVGPSGGPSCPCRGRAPSLPCLPGSRGRQSIRAQDSEGEMMLGVPALRALRAFGPCWLKADGCLLPLSRARLRALRTFGRCWLKPES